MDVQQADEPQREEDMEQTPSNASPAGSPNGGFTFSNPLPGGGDKWQSSPLGEPQSWPDALKSYSMTIASLKYPAAIFWGEEFILLHNQEWIDAGGVGEQGQKHRGKLAADAFSGLSSTLHGGIPKRTNSRALLRADRAGNSREYTVLVSPLFDSINPLSETANGTLAQLLLLPDIYGQGTRHETSTDLLPRINHLDLTKAGHKPELDISQLGTVVDNLPLDEHPFFHRFAEMLPSGLAILDHKAQAVFVNQHFYQLTTHRGDDQSFKSWPQSIHPDDYDRVMNAYHDAFVSQQQLRTEFRAQGKRNPWRLLLLTPLGDENLQHVSLREYGGFICSIVDISSGKSAELAERKAAKEARERKEQQERFIDMISHEIRNPLSAVLHCSEDIEEAVSDKKNIDVVGIIEAVETINLCIQHQRNIVDDVLSFSKLDSSMLSLTPKPSRPSQSLASSLKMFQPEFRKQHMEFGYSVDCSYEDLHIRWVMADMARISQVLINLVTNAIKFTARSKGEKRVVVSLGASIERPKSYPPNVVFFNSEDTVYRMDGTSCKDWGTGEPAYIMVAVKDTGIGISKEDQKRLFERFRQATPKTGEMYGGSGLGLNISRKMCHLHGGEIGVKSEEGEGSTFGFFFKVRRSDPPADYEGRPEEETMNDDSLKDQIKDLGNASPDYVDPALVPKSLTEPPVQSPEESSPYTNGQDDDQYRATASAASQVQQQHDAKSPRPESSTDSRNANPETEETSSPTLPGQHESHPDQDQHHSAQSERENSRAHVLLVEDNVINQRIIFKKLESKGFIVTTANNGREAVEIVKDPPEASDGVKVVFDVILMDQEMPVLDGSAATKAIRELEEKGELAHIPILGVTANVRIEQQDEMIAAGMDDVMSKPYRIKQMVEKIKRLVKTAPK